MKIVLRQRDAAGTALGDTSSDTVLEPTWQHVTVDAVVTAPTSSVEVYFGADDQIAGTCFAVDDVCLVRVN